MRASKGLLVTIGIVIILVIVIIFKINNKENLVEVSVAEVSINDIHKYDTGENYSNVVSALEDGITTLVDGYNCTYAVITSDKSYNKIDATYTIDDKSVTIDTKFGGGEEGEIFSKRSKILMIKNADNIDIRNSVANDFSKKAVYDIIMLKDKGTDKYIAYSERYGTLKKKIIGYHREGVYRVVLQDNEEGGLDVHKSEKLNGIEVTCKVKEYSEEGRNATIELGNNTLNVEVPTNKLIAGETYKTWVEYDYTNSKFSITVEE